MVLGQKGDVRSLRVIHVSWGGKPSFILTSGQQIYTCFDRMAIAKNIFFKTPSIALHFGH